MLRKQHVLNAPKRMRETRSPISPRELSRLGHGFPFLILDSHKSDLLRYRMILTSQNFLWMDLVIA